MRQRWLIESCNLTKQIIGEIKMNREYLLGLVTELVNNAGKKGGLSSYETVKAAIRAKFLAPDDYEFCLKTAAKLLKI